MISPEPHARYLPKYLCMLPMSVALSSSGMFTIGRIAYRWEGVFFPLKMHYRPGKGDGSAQRGRSMLSTIALLLLYADLRKISFSRITLANLTCVYSAQR